VTAYAFALGRFCYRTLSLMRAVRRAMLANFGKAVSCCAKCIDNGFFFFYNKVKYTKYFTARQAKR
jgi:hypothetical protein